VSTDSQNSVISTPVSTSSKSSTHSSTVASTTPPVQSDSSSTISSTSTSATSLDQSSPSFTGSSTNQIAIGVGVGVGVPFLIIAILAWLFPGPLQRLASKKKSDLQPQPEMKPELPASTHQTITDPTMTFWNPQMASQNSEGWLAYQPQGPSTLPMELHGYNRSELQGQARSELGH
jgi:hypothetical protein